MSVKTSQTGSTAVQEAHPKRRGRGADNAASRNQFASVSSVAALQWLFPSPSVDFVSFYQKAALRPVDVAARTSAFRAVASLVTQIWPDALTMMYGSLTYRAALYESDVDVSVAANKNADGSVADPVTALRCICDAASAAFGPRLKDTLLISTASIPVLKLTIAGSAPPSATASTSTAAGAPLLAGWDTGEDIRIDVTHVPLEVVQSGRSLRTSLDAHPEARPLVAFLKVLLEQHGLHVPYHGGLNSYSLCGLVLAYLTDHKARAAAAADVAEGITPAEHQGGRETCCSLSTLEPPPCAVTVPSYPPVPFDSPADCSVPVASYRGELISLAAAAEVFRQTPPQSDARELDDSSPGQEQAANDAASLQAVHSNSPPSNPEGLRGVYPRWTCPASRAASSAWHSCDLDHSVMACLRHSNPANPCNSPHQPEDVPGSGVALAVLLLDFLRFYAEFPVEHYAILFCDADHPFLPRSHPVFLDIAGLTQEAAIQLSPQTLCIYDGYDSSNLALKSFLFHGTIRNLFGQLYLHMCQSLSMSLTGQVAAPPTILDMLLNCSAVSAKYLHMIGYRPSVPAVISPHVITVLSIVRVLATETAARRVLTSEEAACYRMWMVEAEASLQSCNIIHVFREESSQRYQSITNMEAAARLQLLLNRATMHHATLLSEYSGALAELSRESMSERLVLEHNEACHHLLNDLATTIRSMAKHIPSRKQRRFVDKPRAAVPAVPAPAGAGEPSSESIPSKDPPIAAEVQAEAPKHPNPAETLKPASCTRSERGSSDHTRRRAPSSSSSDSVHEFPLPVAPPRRRDKTDKRSISKVDSDDDVLSAYLAEVGEQNDAIPEVLVWGTQTSETVFGGLMDNPVLARLRTSDMPADLLQATVYSTDASWRAAARAKSYRAWALCWPPQPGTPLSAKGGTPRHISVGGTVLSSPDLASLVGSGGRGSAPEQCGATVLLRLQSNIPIVDQLTAAYPGMGIRDMAGGPWAGSPQFSTNIPGTADSRHRDGRRTPSLVSPFGTAIFFVFELGRHRTMKAWPSEVPGSWLAALGAAAPGEDHKRSAIAGRDLTLNVHEKVSHAFVYRNQVTISAFARVGDLIRATEGVPALPRLPGAEGPASPPPRIISEVLLVAPPKQNKSLDTTKSFAEQRVADNSSIAIVFAPDGSPSPYLSPRGALPVGSNVMGTTPRYVP